jgi:hypothetical protein
VRIVRTLFASKAVMMEINVKCITLCMLSPYRDRLPAGSQKAAMLTLGPCYCYLCSPTVAFFWRKGKSVNTWARTDYGPEKLEHHYNQS